jgi:O-antigen ligase
MKVAFFRWGNRAFDALVLGAVAWSTLALGATSGWGLAVTYGLLAAALCLWAGMRLLAGDKSNSSGEAQQAANRDLAIAASADGQSPPLKVQSQAACILALSLAAYVILQVFPLPLGLVERLSPARAAQELKFSNALQGDSLQSLTLSVDPAATRRAMNLLAAAVMALTAGAYLSTSRIRARRALQVLIGLALVEALYGLLENLTGHRHIFWIPVEGEFARGTFFNRNHYAATLALFLPATIGWFFFRAAAAKAQYERAHAMPAMPWDILGSRQGLWLLAPAILMLGIVQSQSRGGFSAMLLGTALMVAIGTRSRSLRLVAWLSIPLAVALFAFGINSDYQAMLDRFGEIAKDAHAEGRFTIWRDSLGILRDYPLFGVGFGNFPRVYMQYASAGTLVYPYQAHNEWLEGLITLGGIGMALVLAAAIGFGVKTFRQVRQARRDQPWLLGCWCGLIALAVHSIGEFNLHIPSIAVSASLLAGILLGSDRSDRSDGSDKSDAGRLRAANRRNARARRPQPPIRDSASRIRVSV